MLGQKTKIKLSSGDWFVTVQFAFFELPFGLIYVYKAFGISSPSRRTYETYNQLPVPGGLYGPQILLLPCRLDHSVSCLGRIPQFNPLLG